jgi:hypothetical protein
VEIEIVVDGQNKLEYFPMQPQCFMLTSAQRVLFLKECDMRDSTNRMVDYMNCFPIFSKTLEAYLELFRKWPLGFTLTEGQWLRHYMQILFGLGLLLNFILLIDLRLDEDEHFVMADKNAEMVTIVISWMILTIATLVLLTWMVVRYPIRLLQHTQSFIVFNKSKNERDQLWRLKIAVLDTLLNESIVISTVVHILGAILHLIGYWMPVIIHLFLIFHISRSTQRLVAAVSLRFTQIVKTFILMTFVV